MALTVEKGTFTKTTSSSTPVSQTVNLVDSTLTPKAVILWTAGHTAGDTYVDDARFSFGFSDGTNHACQAYRMDESLETEAYAFYNDKIISIINTGGASVDSLAHVSAVAAGSFTLSWTTQADINALIIHYIVIGGSDISNASVVSTTTADVNSGNHAFSGSGTTFTPDFAITMTGGSSYSSTSTLSSGADNSLISIGAVTSSNQWVVCGRDETVGTSDCDMYIDNANCLAAMNTGSGAISYLANFVSFDNAAGGGMTVNVSNNADITNARLAFLFLKGSSNAVFEAGTFQQRSGTGTQDVTFTNTALDPSLVFLAGINSTQLAGSTPPTNMYLGVGASDGTREGCSYFGNANALGTFTAVRNDSSTKVYRQATPAATATSSTTNAECDMNDMATAGKFQLNWTTADSTQRYMAFWTVGTQPLYATATSIHKYNINAMVTQTSIHEYHIAPENFTVLTKVGIITKDATTGAHTQNFTNELGFAPKAIIFWTTNRTATGIAAHLHFNMGFTDGTNHFCSSLFHRDATNSGSQVGCRNSNTSSIIVEAAATLSTTTLSEATTTLGSNGFDVVWTKADATQNKIMYWAIGGTSIMNAKVTSQTHAGTGSRTYSTTGFQGDVAFFLGAPIAIAGTTVAGGISLGAATSSSNEFCITLHHVSPFPADFARRQVTNRCIMGVISGNPGTVETEADFTAFTSTGYTLNYTSAATGDQFGALVIKGGLWDVGAFNQNTSNGTQQVNITTSRLPKAVFLSTFGDAATSSVLDHERVSCGLMDGTTEASTWIGSEDAVTTQVAKTDLSDTKVIRTIDETSGGGTLLTEADFSSFQNDSFTINNTTTDATSRQICYVVVSNSAPTNVAVERALATETITISDSGATLLRNKIRTRTDTAITIAETPTRLSTKLRPIAAQTTTVTEPAPPARIKGKLKAPATETITVGGGTLARLANKIRTRTETVTIPENVARLGTKTRALATQTVTIGGGTAAILSGITRAISQTVTITEVSLTRLAVKTRALATQTVTVSGGTLARLSTKTRALAVQTVTITEISLAKLGTKTRALATQTTTVAGGTLARLSGKSRARSDTATTITEISTTRLAAKTRTRSDTVISSESVERTPTTAGPKDIEKSASDDITISELSFNRLSSKWRRIGGGAT